MHLAVKECQLNKMGATKSLGKKFTLEYRGDYLGMGENAPRKSIFLAMALWNKSLYGVQTVSSGCGVIVTVFGGNGFCTNCHYYLRVGLLGLSSVSPHSAVYQSA